MNTLPPPLPGTVLGDLLTSGPTVEAYATSSSALKTLEYKLTPENNPARFWNRRGRAANKAKIDKTQRNQRQVRILRNGQKKFPDQITDMRVTAGVHSEYAIPRVLTRGAREGIRFVERNKKLNELIDDQRCREHIYQEELRAADKLDDLAEFEAACDAARDKYNQNGGLPPVTPRIPTGPLNNYVAQKGRYASAE